MLAGTASRDELGLGVIPAICIRDLNGGHYEQRNGADENARNFGNCKPFIPINHAASAVARLG